VTDRPGVEPLSAAAWTRVRTGVVGDLDRKRAMGSAADERPADRSRRRRWVQVGAVAAVACVAVLAGLALLGEQDPATWRVVTEDEPSHVAAGDAEIRVAARSSVVMHLDGSGNVSVDLERGSVECEVTPRAGRRPFSVRAGRVVVKVVGTLFSVKLRDKAVHVAVTHGTVEVLADGETHRVPAGAVWSNAAAGEAVAVAPAPGSDAEPDTVGGTPSAGAPAHPGLTLETEANAAGASNSGAQPGDRLIDEAAEGGQPPPAHAEEPGAAPEPDRVEDGAPGAAPRAVRPAKSEKASRPAKPRPVPRKAPKRLTAVQERRLFDKAQRMSASDPERAIELFSRVAEGSGTWAALALYAQADLELQRGKRAAARSLLRRYLNRFPRGPNADDARRSLEQSE